MADFLRMILDDLDSPFNGLDFVNSSLQTEGWEQKYKSNIAEISDRTQKEITSVDFYRNVIVALAQMNDVNPGRLVVIHYLSEEVKKQFLPKLTGISYEEYRQEFPKLQSISLGKKKWIECHRLHQRIESMRVTAIQFGWMKLQQTLEGNRGENK